MRDLSRPARILSSAALFIVCYIPVSLLWSQALPSYSRFVAAVSETFVNMIEFSNTTYRIAVKENDYQVTARLSADDGTGRSQRYELDGTRKADLVSYNLSLWFCLLLATIYWIRPSLRWKFITIAPMILFIWHICDLTIFSKNTRWILVKDLHDKNPAMIGYSYSWNWFWFWAKELNRRIVDPFLPLLLWIIFWAKSFLVSKSSKV